MNLQSTNGGTPKNPWKERTRNASEASKKSSEEKFRDMQEKLQTAVQNHLNEQECESSEEEEISETDSILKSVFKNYDQYVSGHTGTEKTQQFLENIFQSGAAVCLICLGSIKRADPIWNCLECYGYFHLTCIQMWSKDSLHQQKLIESELPAFKKSKIYWACPKCRHNYEQNEIPNRYYCFCGKVEDPSYHPWLIPHSCGETCGKKLQPECGHSCLLLCHPGPCPPCPKTVQSYCYCGKKGPKQQRCSNKFWSCQTKCSKPLMCNKHSCDAICHSGECPSCNKKSIQKCQCGLQQRKQSCYTPSWQCDKVCGKPFTCGFHNCSLVCHKGPCGVCPGSLERNCPCGKNKFQLPCTDDIPTCLETCEKLLECGVHRCAQKCHKLKCGACLEMEVKQCRCGLHKKKLPCHKSFFCETKCKKMKNCLKHPCNKKCCDQKCPPCDKPCGKTLKCGYHKCPSVCHIGHCYPCPQVAQVKCHCGQTALTVACGRQKRTTPPKCNFPCFIPPNCHHPSREPHTCHFGTCPPCKQICGKDLENCSHQCPAPCHSAVRVKIEKNYQPSGPWEEVKPKIKLSNLPCPDCLVPVPTACFGGHETMNRPCHEAQPLSCPRPCGRLLLCGNHTCQKKCHLVTGAKDNTIAGEECLKCELKCQKKRPHGCTHPCSLPCHPGSCPPCNLNFKIKCHCGICVLHLQCEDLNNADAKAHEDLLSCGNSCPKVYSCGHKCKANCHSGTCPDEDSCRKKVKLNCPCGRLKKTLTCDVVRTEKLIAIDCDDECKAALMERKKMKEIEDEKIRQENEKRNREGIEKFERKFHFGRAKHKKKLQQTNEPSTLPRFWIVLLIVFTVLSAILIYFLV